MAGEIGTGKKRYVPLLSGHSQQKYLIAHEPGATVSFDFKTTSLGIVHIDFLRSATFGLGSVECWVDDDTDRKKKLEGYWNLPYNIGR